MDEEKLRVLMEVESDHQIDLEEDSFDLGMLKMHGLIDDNLNVTPQGEKAYLEMIVGKDSEI